LYSDPCLPPCLTLVLYTLLLARSSVSSVGLWTLS
jgi:hypothetical protein